MIKTKAKKCKGSGIAKGYGCGRVVDHRIYGLCTQFKCYYTWLLESEAGKQKRERATIQVVSKSAKRREMMERAAKERSERKSIVYLLENVRTACHQYIKLRDKGKPCISCGALWDSTHQAGHFYKAELYSSLKFHEHNIHSQCQKCNIHKEGNESPYRVALIEKFGPEYVKALDGLATMERQSSHFKWDREDLQALRVYYKRKIKELKNKSPELFT